MKTVLTPLLILALNSPLNAQVLTSSEITDLVKNVDSINNGQLTNPIAPMCINGFIDLNDKNKINIDALYNKCAVDLCGLPGTNPSVFVTDDSYAKYLTNATNKKINDNLPLIEKVVDKNLKVKKKELDQVKKFLNNPQQVYLKLDSVDKKEMNKSVFSKYVKTEFVKDGKVKDRIKVKVTPPVWADDNFKKALNTYSENFKLAQNNDQETVKELQLSTDELKQYSQDLISTIEGELKTNSKLLSEDMLTILSLLKTGLNEKDVTPKYLETGLSTIARIQENMTSQTLPSYGGDLCDTSECVAARALYLKQPMITQPLEKMSKEINAPQLRQQSINGCKAGLISAGIEAADEKKTQAVYQEALKSIKANYVAKFSAHSKGLLENYLSSIVTKASPLDRSKQKEKNVDVFKKKATGYISEPIVNLENSEVANAALDLINNPVQLNTASIAAPCDDYGANLWEMFLSAKKLEIILGNSKILNGKDHIYISPFSCQHSDHGKQVLAHEIGHALNSFFQYNTVSESSAKNFKDLRTCAKNQYKDSQPVAKLNLSIPGDSLLTEEDHADLISYMAIGGKTLYTCPFLIPSLTDKKSYTNLDFKNVVADTHSTSFSRVIFEAINKKIDLPQSCNDLIKEVKPEMSFKKCI